MEMPLNGQPSNPPGDGGGMLSAKPLVHGTFLQSLPSAPDVIHRIPEWRDAAIQTDGCLQSIKTDPALVARVLASANLNPLNTSIGSLDEAACRLGAQLSKVASRAYFQSGISNSAGLMGYWTVVRWRSEIVKALHVEIDSGVSDDEAHCFGLIGDIGYLAVLSDILSRGAELVSEDLIESSQHQSAPITKAVLLECGVPLYWYHWLSLPTDSKIASSHQACDSMSAIFRLAHEVAMSWWKGVHDELSISRIVRVTAKYTTTKERHRWVAKIMDVFATIGTHRIHSTHAVEYAGNQKGQRSVTSRALPESGLRCLLMGFSSGESGYLESIIQEASHGVSTQSISDLNLGSLLCSNSDCLVINAAHQYSSAIQLCSDIRGMNADRQVYIIAVVSDLCEVQCEALLHAGADDILGKSATRLISAKLIAAQRWMSLQSSLDKQSKKLKAAAKALLERNEMLEWQANSDALTGISNRRHAMEVLKRETARAARHSRSLSVALIDLDNFKNINDTHGHDVGDQVLINSAELLSSALRYDDHLSRIGGEEFLVIMPETDHIGAKVVMERLRDALRASAIVAPTGHQVSVTASIGCAVITHVMNVDAWQDLMTCADKAMYSVKRSTKNAARVVRLKQKH